jgi:hypothetical protein
MGRPPSDMPRWENAADRGSSATPLPLPWKQKGVGICGQEFVVRNLWSGICGQEFVVRNLCPQYRIRGKQLQVQSQGFGI